MDGKYDGAANCIRAYKPIRGLVVLHAIEHGCQFVKVNRAKWEVAIKTLPKQVVPYLMLRLNMMSGSVAGLREAALLSRAWGISRRHVVRGLTSSAMYFTSFEGLDTAYDAMADILDDWPADNL